MVKDDTAFISQSITDDICWKIVGNISIQDKEDVTKELKERRHQNMKEMVINTIVTHGYNGAVEGTLTFNNGTVLAFCDVYTFNASTNNAKIKAISSYIIKNI